MSIGEIINSYGKDQSPYDRGIVNHLPMGQLALYKLSGDLDRVRRCTEKYLKNAKINLIRDSYSKFHTIEDHLGKRDTFESCLEVVESKINQEGLDNFISYILEKYPLGMSAGVFHTIIRLAYAVDGYSIDKALIDEIARALAYYITGYREASLLGRKIPGDQIKKEMESLSSDTYFRNLLKDTTSMGRGLKALYSDKEYLERGFIIDGDEEAKIRGLLDLLIPTYYNSGNIVVLHSITAIHALIVIRNYFEDFKRALDILTTCIVTHLMTVNYLRYDGEIPNHTGLSWGCIKVKAADASDVHAIKLTYSCYELDKFFNLPGLKDIALKRIKQE